jgi:hypothetical protein
MLDLLYEYLIHYNEIVVPGLGTIRLQRSPAYSDITEHSISAPSYAYHWEPGDHRFPPAFLSWLSNKMNVPEEEAAICLNNYVEELKKEINAGKEITWQGVGIIRRGLDSAIEFEPDAKELIGQKKVFAEKVIHEHDSHVLLVGDKEKTNFEMAEILHLPEPQQTNWLRIALIAAAIAVIFIVWYVSANGFSPESVSNRNKISPKDAPASYH